MANRVEATITQGEKFFALSYGCNFQSIEQMILSFENPKILGFNLFVHLLESH